MLPPFGWSTAVTQWQFAPIVSAFVAISLVLYCWGVIRVARRHPARPWPAWRTLMFMGGLAVIVIATQSGVGAYDDVLFWDHMVQHLMLIMVAPPLLIFGQPITLLMHASRNPLHSWTKRVLRSKVASFLTWPVFGAVAYTAVVVGAHLTSLANDVANNQTLHNGEHAVFLIVGYLFFLPLLGKEPIRWRISYPLRFVTLVLLMPVDTFTGIVLGYSGRGAPGLPAGPIPSWAPNAVSDLHDGGAVMWVGGDAIMFALMMVVFLMWSMDERAATSGHGWLEGVRRANMATLVASNQHAAAGAAGTGGPSAGDGAEGEPAAVGGVQWSARGGIDDDEHLAAYNDFLSRLNRGQHGPER